MIAKLDTLLKPLPGPLVLIHYYRALGAAIVTIPSTWYLMQPQIERWNRPKGSGHGHGHGDEGEGHEEHGEDSEGGEEGEGQESEDDKGGDESEEGGGGDGHKSDDSDSEGGEQDTPDTSDDEEGSKNEAKVVDSGKNVPGVQFKGATSGGTGDNHEQGDTRKHIPDAKGGNKKRIESDYAKVQGQANKPEEDPAGKDMVIYPPNGHTPPKTPHKNPPPKAPHRKT